MRGGGPPRRHGPGLPGDGRRVLLRRPPQGGLRHRDPLAGHQHARPFGRHRALHQVRGGRPGHPDVGRVPPAHRPRRAPRPRRRGARGRPVVERDGVRRGGPRGLGAPARPALVLPPDVQPGRQPGLPVRSGEGRRRAAPFLRPVAGQAAGPPDRPAQSPGGRAGGAGIPRRLVADAVGPPPGAHLPRVRPPHRRGAGRRSAQRRGSLGPRRSGVGRGLRAPPGPTGRFRRPPAAAAARGRWPTGWGRSGWPSCSGAAPPSSTSPSASGRSRRSISYRAPANPLRAWPLRLRPGPVGARSRPPWRSPPATWATWPPGTSYAPSSRWPTSSSSWRTSPPTRRRRHRPGRPSGCSCGASSPPACPPPDHPPRVPHPSPMVGRPCSPT